MAKAAATTAAQTGQGLSQIFIADGVPVRWVQLQDLRPRLDGRRDGGAVNSAARSKPSTSRSSTTVPSWTTCALTHRPDKTGARAMT
jgi:hypothetical protein